MAGIAISTSVSSAYALAQRAGVTSYTDPLEAGYLYRASNMLLTGNPLGTLDQLNTIIDEPCATDNKQSASRLGMEGAALFERQDPACLEVLARVVNEYPATPEATQALLTIGDWYWYQKDWHKALANYNRIIISELPGDQRNLYSYREALAYLNCGLPEKAAPLFHSLKNSKDYSIAADYYSAYILYLKGDYDEAYDRMASVASQSATLPSGIEPLYYMAQIEYLRGDYDDVIRHANTLTNRSLVPELLPELHRITGLSYFKTGDTDQARLHLEQFVNSTEAPNDDALYALAATEYADGDLAKARDRFRSLTDRDNMIAQGAYLYLGQIAEHEGDMNEAAMNFNKAANMAYDPKVAETAMYNYIVANSKGGNVPFASSITMHEDFLRQFPSSKYASHVEESLATALFRENDYAKALQAINRVKNPSAATLSTKQKILYKLGCGEISSGQLKSAIAHLREAAGINGEDRAISAESRFWLGEALYRSGNFPESASAYSSSLKGDLSEANRVLARYGLAYSQFQTKDWSEARKNFAAVANDRNAAYGIIGDALVREGDCLLYLHQYVDAADKYQKVITDNIGDSDYAAFRHAVVTGVTGNTDRKITELDAFLRDREGSKWTPEVLLEAARTYTALERPDKANLYYDRLLEVQPDSPQVIEAILNKAEYLEKSGDLPGALEAYLTLEERGGKDFATIATSGVMRNTSDIHQRAEYADRLLKMSGVDPVDAENARFYSAVGLLQGNDPETGVNALSQLAENTDHISGAMAAVELGDWYLEKGEIRKALEVLEKFTDTGSVHAYWLARGFISLADAYHAEGNDYLATEYLKSLKENYPGTEQDIRDAINDKIKQYSE